MLSRRAGLSAIAGLSCSFSCKSCPSVCPTQQLNLGADAKYFLLLSICCSVIADAHRSCRSSQPCTCSIAHSVNYRLHVEALLFLDEARDTPGSITQGCCTIAGPSR